jgi:predicted acylesterase/phospholipase RssA
VDGSTPPVGTTLRFALGMRGGVSLAVWIGGAAAELDDLRCALDADEYHRRLTSLGGYSDVEIDVMSGASAGGLNAVLAAAAMVGQRRVGEMREIWLEVGGLRELLESDVAGDRTRRSLLGGEYFRTHIRQEVARLLRPPDAPTAPPLRHRLEVFLSATVHRGMHVPIEDDDYSPDAARRSGALFHFRHLAADPATSDLFGSDVIDDLTRAARTTASFPTAFEPMLFEPGDMPGELILPAVAVDPVWLLDGGIVDNIPVARAIRGVPDVPASTATDRWLIYLQPSPDSLVQKKPQRPGTPTLLNVAGGLLTAFMSESILDDVEVMRTHNLEAIEVRQAWSDAVGELSSGGRDEPEPTIAADSVDGTRIVAVLLQPVQELVWRPIGVAVGASPLGNADSSQIAAFRAAVDAAVTRRVQSVRPFAALVRTAALLTDWARELEQVAAGDAGRLASLGSVKLGCYHAMQLAQVLAATTDFTGLQFAVAGARADPASPTPDASGVVATMGDVTDRLLGDARLLSLLAQFPLPARELATAVQTHPVLGELFSDRYSDGPQSGGGDAGEPATTGAPKRLDAELWANLASRASRLATLAGSDDHPVDGIVGSRIDVGPLVRAVRSCDGNEPSIERVLRLIDRRTVGVHRGRATALPTPLKYVRIAGSNLSPLCLRPHEFQYAGPRFSSAELLSDAAGTVAPRMKLAGSDLANFSAFISQRWRANDWMWGRLDAAKSIVDVVTARGRLGNDPDTQHAAVAAIVTAPFPDHPATPAAWRVELQAAADDLWRRHGGTVRSELDAQFDSMADEPLAVTKRVLVLRRHWEILATELPTVLAADLRPVAATAPPLPPTVAQAVQRYESSPRSFGAVWGMRWSTALGIRAAYEIWAATRPTTALGRAARAPLKPLPMSTLGTVLARNRGLLGLALLFNLVVLPRLHGGGAWVSWALGVLGGTGIAWVFGKHARGARVSPLERHGTAYRAAAGLTFAASAAVLVSRRLRGNLYDMDPGTVLTHFNRHLVVPFTVLAFAVAFVATVLLWCWARWAWRIVASLVVAALTTFWTVFSRMHHTPTACWPVRLAFGFGSLWWAVLLSVGVTTTIAHLAFRSNVQIAEYARD